MQLCAKLNVSQLMSVVNERYHIFLSKFCLENVINRCASNVNINLFPWSLASRPIDFIFFVCSIYFTLNFLKLRSKKVSCIEKAASYFSANSTRIFFAYDTVAALKIFCCEVFCNFSISRNKSFLHDKLIVTISRSFHYTTAS